MTTYRVLIISDQPLFAQGVRTLVETRTDVTVIGIETFGADTLARITSLQPNIIILGEDRNSFSALPLALLDAVPDVRVIRLSLDGNVIHVYDGHQFAAKSADDLVGTLIAAPASSPVVA